MEKQFLNYYINVYDVPTECKSCGGGVLIYRGLGEYACEECGAVYYDNYGKARTYIEQHPGATETEVEENAGVSKESMRLMIKEARFEVAKGAHSFIYCEICHREIRSGRYCYDCEKNIHLTIEQNVRRKIQGFAMNVNTSGSEKGQRRFIRDKDS